MAERTIVVRRMTIMMRFNKTIFFGVFLSPRAFLKSLMILLKVTLPFYVEDIDDIDWAALIRAALPAV